MAFTPTLAVDIHDARRMLNSPADIALTAAIHTKTLVPWAFERLTFKQSQENTASHDVTTAEGTVLASSREMLAGILSEMRWSAIGY